MMLLRVKSTLIYSASHIHHKQLRQTQHPCLLSKCLLPRKPQWDLLQRGKTPPKTVFFVLHHAARAFPNEEVRLTFIDSVNEIVELILGPKNVKWEYNIGEHPADN